MKDVEGSLGAAGEDPLWLHAPADEPSSVYTPLADLYFFYWCTVTRTTRLAEFTESKETLRDNVRLRVWLAMVRGGHSKNLRLWRTDRREKTF